VNHLVLSRTPTIVPSGTGSSCYRGPKSGKISCLSKACRASNLSNLDSFGIYLTNFAFSPVGEKTHAAATERVTIVTLLKWESDISKTTVAIDSVGGRAHQGRRVIVIDADPKGEKENCWLHWSKKRAKKGLTRQLEVIGLVPGVPRLKALKNAYAIDHVVTGGGLPRFAVWTRSALLASDIALTPFQPSPSSEGASVEIRRLLEKAQIFRPDLPLASSSIAMGLAT
jgi:hypothetical protein